LDLRPVYGPAMPISTLPATAGVAIVLLAGTGCARTTGDDVRRLPALRPAELTSSALAPAPTAPSGALPAATAVVRRYYSLLDGLRRQMRAAPLAGLMTADCPCRAQVRAVRAAIGRGERYTDRVRVIRLVPHLDRADLVDVFVTLDVRRGGLLDPSGRRSTPMTTARDLHRELLLRRIGGHWLIARVIAV
jgi:hypothetical protein